MALSKAKTGRKTKQGFLQGEMVAAVCVFWCVGWPGELPKML